MAIIDSIKIGQPMPAIIPDQEARGDDIEKIESVDIGRSMTYCYTYIPYYPNNINYAVLDGRMRDAISSRFTGCLMVAWEENGQIKAGHVHKGPAHDCGSIWAGKRDNPSTVRSFSFKPSDVHIANSDGLLVPNCYGFITFNDTFDILAAYSVVTDCNNIVTMKELMFKGAFTGKIEI